MFSSALVLAASNSWKEISIPFTDAIFVGRGSLLENKSVKINDKIANAIIATTNTPAFFLIVPIKAIPKLFYFLMILSNFTACKDINKN
jgi:hypothetical protein